MGAELLHVDGRIDLTKVTVAVAILRMLQNTQLLKGIPAAFLEILHTGGQTDGKI